MLQIDQRQHPESVGKTELLTQHLFQFTFIIDQKFRQNGQSSTCTNRNFLRQNTVALRFGGTLLATVSKGVLVFAADI